MKTDAYNLFKSMFLILDKMWEENQDEELRIYLSDADSMFCEKGTILRKWNAIRRELLENSNFFDIIN